MITKKFLFCKKCLEYPDTIIQEALMPSRQALSWNEKDKDYTEVEDYDQDFDGETRLVCSECGKELEEIEFDDLDKKTKAVMVARKIQQQRKKQKTL